MKRNRESRVECPQCRQAYYTVLALNKHVAEAHGLAQRWRALVQRGIRAGLFKAAE